MGGNEYKNKIPVENIDFFCFHKNRSDLNYIATGADSTVYRWSRFNETDKVLKYYHKKELPKTDLRIYADLLNECSKEIQDKPLDSSIGSINFVIVPVETVTSVFLPNYGECSVSVSPYIDGPMLRQIESDNFHHKCIPTFEPKKHIINFIEAWKYHNNFRNPILDHLTQLGQTLKEICGSINVGCDGINTKLSYQKKQGYRFNLTDISLVVASLVADKKS
jgi:hypothetical protein